MKFPNDSYALLSPSKNELKIVLHFCMVLSLSHLLEKVRPKQALTGRLEGTDYKDMQEKYCNFAKETLRI